MLTQEEDVDVKALYKQGWSISAIARHLDRDRKTIRGYVNGEREPGQRKPAGPDVFAPFERYVRSRLGEDPHLWATRCLTRSSRWAIRGPISRSPARSASVICARTASPARGSVDARRRIFPHAA
jgi:transposase